MKLIPLGALAALSLLAAGCSGCQTFPQDDIHRANTVARGAHGTACSAVASAHRTGALTGEPFNKAKAYCVQADDLLDGAEAALAAGNIALARSNLSAANAQIAKAQNLTPQ